jgi:hypothetical protein
VNYLPDNARFLSEVNANTDELVLSILLWPLSHYLLVIIYYYFQGLYSTLLGLGRVFQFVDPTRSR